ncbi:hypothetical protein ACMA5I_15200 [Paracoccaceae bacterium GXU_MW_L88]
MPKIDDAPFVWLNFDKRHQLLDVQESLRALHKAIQKSQATDLLIISHGWKTTKKQAARIYSEVWRHTKGYIPKDKTFVLAGVSWPALAFPVDFDGEAIRDAFAGATDAPPSGGHQDLDTETFEKILRQSLPGEENKSLRNLFRQVEKDGTDQGNLKALADGLAEHLRELSTESDPQLNDEIELIANEITRDPRVLLHVCRSPMITNEGGASDLDAIARVFLGLTASLARFLNNFSYYAMKRRSGDIGISLGRHLDRQNFLQDIRVHLAGHSFGARLVTASAAATSTLKLQSLTLLQAAYSHYGLANNSPSGKGAFANALQNRRVQGAIAITHTHNDLACKILYPFASRFSGDGASEFGDADDRYGAMGANGAQFVNAIAHPDFPTNSKRLPVAGRVNNYLADNVVKKIDGKTAAHNNIQNDGVGRLLAAAMSS